MLRLEDLWSCVCNTLDIELTRTGRGSLAVCLLDETAIFTHADVACSVLCSLLQDGVTQVADPSGCRHISPAALAYAAAMTSFLRSSDNQLPVWDKRFGRWGCCKLAVVINTL